MTVEQGVVATAQGEPPGFVARIVAGDRSAEAEFVQHYARGVRALVRRHCRPGDPAAEDLAQDVLANVLERLRAGAVREPAALPAYVQAAVVYATSGEYRRRRLREPVALSDALPAPDDPLEHTSAAQRGVLLRSLLQHLPVARDREILARFYLDEQDKDDVCRALGIDAEHFHRVVFRARERFRQVLGAAGIGEPE